MLGGVVGWLAWWKQQPQRDAAAAQTWTQFHQYATGHHLDLLYIDDDYQHGNQGSKAFVSICDSSDVQSTDTSADQPNDNGDEAPVKRRSAATPFYRGIPSSEVGSEPQPLFVALDLAQDHPGRGRDVLNDWTPPEPWRRVW